jgi:hypothetical protein
MIGDGIADTYIFSLDIFLYTVGEKIFFGKLINSPSTTADGKTRLRSEILAFFA